MDATMNDPTDQSGKRVVGDGRSEYTGQNLPMRPQFRSEHDSEQHGLVADLRQGDHSDRRKEGFDHSRAR